MKDGTEGALAMVLKEAEIYRAMVSVLLEKLHEAYRHDQKRYRLLRENHVTANVDR